MNAGHMTTINASDFKARCLAILDRVHETGERVVILKRGKPVAELSRVLSEGNRYPQGELEETVIIDGDVVEPVFPEEQWDSLK
ncbi:MAG: type II toxin-antitoxin system Phd/YefM family antitoxin [Gemmatimonadetes bacterium]|nr:type II toxin-antitoxin system Phd/YefM family antitoxin [Gemmatimonadota bacterium]